MRSMLLLSLLVSSAPAFAQLSLVPDLSSYLRASDVATAVQSATPVCPAPLPDTLTGGEGAQPTCMPRPDATRPTVIQAKTTVTATNAAWSITWDRPFASPPIYVDAQVYGASDPYLCTVTASDAAGAAGKCYMLVATTLPSVLTSVTGTVVSPFVTAGAGLSVRVVGRQ